MGYILTALGAIGWGISGVCGQYLFTNYNFASATLTTIRMIASGILLIGLSKIQGNNVTSIFKSKKDIGWLFLFSVFGLLLCQYTYLAAIEHSNSSTATVLQALNVILMAIVIALWSKKMLKLNQIISIVLAILGTFLLVTHGNVHTLNVSQLGLFYGLLSALAVVSYTLLSRPIISKYGNTTITGWGMLIGGIFFFVLSKQWQASVYLDLKVILLLAIIIVVGTAAGFSLYLKGVSMIGPQKATIVGCLEPVSATVLSVCLLGTSFQFLDFVGFVMILSTVYICTKE
jgi:drug/metabolite transporter (DMT)-like permease